MEHFLALNKNAVAAVSYNVYDEAMGVFNHGENLNEGTWEVKNGTVRVKHSTASN
jgi:hypothetical protein